MKKKRKRLQKITKRLKQTQLTINNYLNKHHKIFEEMKNKLKKIWACVTILTVLIIFCQSCNVTRKITTESSYFQKGDTACTITTKTTEIYDASKKM